MKSKLRQVMQYLRSKKNSRKNFILSVVALVEVLAILVVSTYAWVESASTIIIQSNGDQPIDTFVYTNAQLTSSSSKEIDLSKYFRASGNMHIASATSPQGTNIYFPRIQTTAASLGSNLFRKGTVNDINTNYISFSLVVEAVDNNVNLLFESEPTFTINGAKVTDSSVRLAVSDGASRKPKIFSMKEESPKMEYFSGEGTQIAYDPVNAFSSYTTTAGTEQKNVLEIPAGNTRKITFKLWLEDPNMSKAVDIKISDLRLVPVGSKTTNVYFLDKTSRYNSVQDTDTANGWGWTDNGGNIMWVYDGATDSIRKMDAEKDDEGYTEWSGSVNSTSIDDPSAKIVFYNCKSGVSRNNVKTNYDCKWETTFAELKEDNLTYKRYTAYGNKNNSNVGYGTWSPSVDLIILDVDNIHGSDKVPAKPTKLTDSANVYLTDTNHSSRLEMYYQYDNVKGTYNWRTFAPNDSSSNIFHLTENGKTYNIGADRRDITESTSTFKITFVSDNESVDPSTGYWVEPATVKVALGKASYTADEVPFGEVSVSGGAPNSTTVKVTAGSSVTLHAKGFSGYGFAGWYHDRQCTGDLISTNPNLEVTAPGENMINLYYAKFLPLYTVTLYSISDNQTVESDTGGTVQINNGNKGKKATLTVLQGSNVTIKANAEESYNFLGWFTNADWNTTEPISGITGTHPVISNIQEDKVYYARFKIKQFTIESQPKYEILNNSNLGTGGKGGTVTINNDSKADSNAKVTITVNYGGEAAFEAFAKDTDGYKFAGWYTDEACTTPAPTVGSYTYTSEEYKTNIDKSNGLIGPSTTNDGTLKLYAKFTLKEYQATAHAAYELNNTITLDNNAYGEVCVVTNSKEGTYGSTASATIKHGGSVVFRAKAKANATFEGWYSDKACKNKCVGLALSNGGKDFTLTIEAKTDVYAKFVPITHTVEAIATPNGFGTVQVNSAATGASSEATVVDGSSVTLKAYPGTNKQFVGWYIDSGCTQSAGTASGSNNTLTISNITADKIYYAKFKATNTVTAVAGSNGQVKVNSKDWTTGTSTDTINTGSSATFYAEPTDSINYKFAGWYTGANGSGTKVSTNATYTISNVTKNYTYYAHFTAVPKIKYYFQNTDNWATPMAYTYRASDFGLGNGDWGTATTKMTKVSGTARTYSIEVPETCDTVVFNNDGGNGTNQTTNITLPKTAGKVYVKSSGKWIDYTGPYRTIYVFANGSDNGLPSWYWSDSCQPAIKPAGNSSATMTHSSVKDGYWCFNKCPYDAYDIYCYRHNSNGDYNEVSLGTPASNVNTINITYKDNNFSNGGWYWKDY